MAITLYGVPLSIDAAHWAKLLAILGRGAADQVVDSGLVPTVATGTRLLSVSAGNAVAAGVLAESTAAEAVTLDANSSGNSRIDYIVLEIDWSGSSSTGGDVKFVKGSPAVNPVPPALTQTPGTLWQIPLARMLVRNGVGQMAGADLELCRPLARLPIFYDFAIDTGAVNFNNSDVVRLNQTILDPGWPYKLVTSARINVVANSPGHASFSVTVNDVDNGSGATPTGNIGDAVIPGRGSQRISGQSAVVKLLVTPTGMTSNLALSSGRVNVQVVPVT